MPMDRKADTYGGIFEGDSLVAQLVKISICNAGDPGSILGSGRSPGEGIGYPLWYSWDSRVAQLVKNPPAVQETWVRSLSWDNILEETLQKLLNKYTYHMKLILIIILFL